MRTTAIKLLGTFQMTLDGQSVTYILKRSYRARLIWISIKPDAGLVVTIPRYYAENNLPQFLVQKKRWILEHLNRQHIDKHQQIEGNRVLFLGKYHNIQRQKAAGSDIFVQIKDNNIVIEDHCSSTEEMTEILKQWLKEKAEQVINDRVLKISKVMSLSFNKINIRDQKTRWASCSYLKNLSFNWRLIMMPEPVIDYIIIHELCHLIKMNHSKSFWKLVQQHCPEWQDDRKWLKDHQTEIRQYPL